MEMLLEPKNRYGIKCMRLDKPEQWVYLEDSDHAIRYAHEIYNNAKVLFYFFKQHYDFKEIFHLYKVDPAYEVDRLGFIAFQFQFQRECLEEIGRLYMGGDP